MSLPQLEIAPTSHLAENSALPPVKIGIVGMNFGAGIARNLSLANPYVQVAGVCDTDLAKSKKLSKELGVAYYHSISELLSDPEVEAVGLFTPPVGRAELVSRVLQRGRHVVTTKPFETDVRAAAAVLKQAQEAGLCVHMNSPAPVPAEDIRQIHDWIREYDLGIPVALRAETWANYRESASGTWYDDTALCPAAPIFRLGIYFLNDFAPLLGDPIGVHVTHSRMFTGRPTADNAQLSIQYRSGALANIFASFCIGDGKPYPDRVTINYERGSITRWIQRARHVDMSRDQGVLELQVGDREPLRVLTKPGAYAGWYDWRSFYQAIRLEGSVQQPIEQVLFGIRLLDAMKRSALSGVPEEVIPEGSLGSSY